MNIAFVSYETPFAPCGGIAAVMGRLPEKVQMAARDGSAVVITPFHHGIPKMAQLGQSHEGSFGVTLADRTVVFHVHRHDLRVPYYFLLPEDRQYFAGHRHPYDISSENLLRDALLFGAAVPQALHVIDPGKRWTLLLQDWEAATALLAMAENPGRSRGFITLHNSYDCSVSVEQLAACGINPDLCPGGTVLQRALPLSELPVFTVSEQFARDLTEDVLQTHILAPHLQLTLKPRLIGIDNGPFTDSAIEPAALQEAEEGNYLPLGEWKEKNRQIFLDALLSFQPSDSQPIWGDSSRFGGGDLPWFVMAGRDDSRQKGYDVLARAVDLFLSEGNAARFLFFPIPGDEGLAGLKFLKKLAERYPANVLTFPFMFREGFLAALRGASYGVMPSLYEPFGMANEFYLNGTVGIGRATGGIVQQIAPLTTTPCHGPHLRRFSDRWHPAGTAPTGLLFRESDSLPTEVEDWRSINAAQYVDADLGCDRVEERSKYPLFQSMAQQLLLALKEGARISQNEPELYYRLLIAGHAHIQRNFSWNRAASDYLRHAVQ